MKKSNISLNDEANLAKLNEEINSDKVKAAVNGGIDNFFNSVNDKKTNAVFPVEITSGQHGFSFAKNADFTNNPAVFIFQRLNYILMALAFSALLPLLLAVLLAKPVTAKLGTLGQPLVLLAISLGLILFLLLDILPNYLNKLVAKSAIVSDPRLVNAVSKLLDTALSRQTTLYIIEIVSLLLLGIILMMFSRAEDKQKLDKIDSKI